MFGVGSSELIITLLVFVLVFLICRELVCWYWKINKNIALLTEIRDLLKAQAPVEVVEALNEKTPAGRPGSENPMDFPSKPAD